MKIPVKFVDKQGKEHVREVEVFHTYARGKEIYRSPIFTHPYDPAKRIYVEFEPDTGEIKVVEVK